VASRGIGVSAPQVGINLRVIAAGSPDEPENIIVAFNPVILDEFGDMVKYEEGCLSFPGLYLKIRRRANIRVRYTTEDGVTDTIKLSGLSARVFQHEIDHLNGILFTDLVDGVEMTRARNKQKQMFRRIKAMRREQEAQHAKQQAFMKRAAKNVKVTPVMEAVEQPTT
jgi:peptide deformylase